jgi:hypothetical protein
MQAYVFLEIELLLLCALHNPLLYFVSAGCVRDEAVKLSGARLELELKLKLKLIQTRMIQKQLRVEVGKCAQKCFCAYGDLRIAPLPACSVDIDIPPVKGPTPLSMFMWEPERGWGRAQRLYVRLYMYVWVAWMDFLLIDAIMEIGR